MSTVRQGACHFRDYMERDTVLPTVTGLRKESDPMSSSTASAPPSPPQTAEPRLSLQCEPIAADTTASTMKNSTTEHSAIVALVALSKW